MTVAGAARMWRTHRAALLGFVMKRVRNAALAEDIVHEVLVKAFARRASLKDPAKLRAWLFQITRNAVADHYRRLRPHEPLPEDLRGDDGDAAERAELELAGCLTPLIARLDAPYRRALTLAELEGVAQKDIAAREGLSLPGAKSRVQRARRMLRDSLISCCRVELDRAGGVLDYRRPNDCNC